jgi:hypothetical protein
MSFKSKKCFGKISRKPLTSYENEVEALEAIKYLKDNHITKSTMVSYKCPECGYFHLSPKSRQTKSVTCGCLDSNNKPKQLYENEESAKRRANIIKKEKHVSLFVYPCPSKKGYHLTHKNPKDYN